MKTIVESYHILNINENTKTMLIYTAGDPIYIIKNYFSQFGSVKVKFQSDLKLLCFVRYYDDRFLVKAKHALCELNI